MKPVPSYSFIGFMIILCYILGVLCIVGGIALCGLSCTTVGSPDNVATIGVLFAMYLVITGFAIIAAGEMMDLFRDLAKNSFETVNSLNSMHFMMYHEKSP